MPAGFFKFRCIPSALPLPDANGLYQSRSLFYHDPVGCIFIITAYIYFMPKSYKRLDIRVFFYILSFDLD